MAGTVADFDINDERFLRLFITIKKIGVPICLEIFHEKFSKNPTVLFQELHSQRRKLKKLFPDQERILFGSFNKETDPSLFDLTLLFSMLFRLDEFENDYRIVLLKDLKRLRDEFSHLGLKPISQNRFERRWYRLKQIFLKFGVSASDIDYYKTAPMDVSEAEKSDVIKELLRGYCSKYSNRRLLADVGNI